MYTSMAIYSDYTIKALTAMCKQYFTDAVYNDRGQMVMYCKDSELAEFDYFLSTHYEVTPVILPEESRDETLERIVYVIDCEEFVRLDKGILSDMAEEMVYYLLGILSSYSLHENYRIHDKSIEFLSSAKTVKELK